MENCINCKYFHNMVVHKYDAPVLLVACKYKSNSVEMYNKIFRKFFKPCKHYKKHKK
jgi:hypothetical protein